MAKGKGLESAAKWREKVMRQRRLRTLPAKGKPVYARIDWGRWIADCPFCSGAERVSKEDKTFFCFSCEMKDNGGAPVPVLFPEGLGKVEAKLEKEKPKYQNWRFEVDGALYKEE